jgi:ABC-type transporter Mla MlaB component
MDRTGTPILHTEALTDSSEAAVLFSARFDGAAEELLRAGLDRSQGAGDRTPWLMLLELLHLLGRKTEFDELAHRFGHAFGRAAVPAWGFPSRVRAPGTFELKGTIADHGALAGLVAYARARATVAIDMALVERIDYGFAATFCELLRVFRMQGKKVILANIAELHASLLHSMGASNQLILLRRRATAEMSGRTGAPLGPEPLADLKAAA